MAGQLGKYQTGTFFSWKGLTKKNHLGAAFSLAPQPASNVMIELLAAQRGKTLDTFLNQFPIKEFESDDEYFWDVVGSSKKNIPLIEARDENGTVVTSADAASGKMVGAGTAPFYLVFGEDWFADGKINLLS